MLRASLKGVQDLKPEAIYSAHVILQFPLANNLQLYAVRQEPRAQESQSNSQRHSSLASPSQPRNNCDDSSPPAVCELRDSLAGSTAAVTVVGGIVAVAPEAALRLGGGLLGLLAGAAGVVGGGHLVALACQLHVQDLHCNRVVGVSPGPFNLQQGVVRLLGNKP